MHIQIRDRYGQINAIEVANFEYLPMFYCFPKELLQHDAKRLLRLPRNPAHILKDKAWLDTVADDAFLSVLLDGAANLVWPAFEVKAHLESFSGDDPLWRLARAIGLCGETLNQLLRPNLMQTLIQNPTIEMPWLTLETATQLFASLAYRAIDEHNLRPMIDTVKQMRCAEDFDDRSSRAKIDFNRKWYHSQTKHPMVSLETLQTTEETALRNGEKSRQIDADFRTSDVFDKFMPSTDVHYMDDRILWRMDLKQLKESLTEKERTILDLRLQGFTQVEIAELLGYSTHSAVTKRLASIGRQYRAFMDAE